MSTLVFDIAQFFPFLNHQLLSKILEKVGCNSKIPHFFSNYLIGRKTQYRWNSFTSTFFNVDVGVGQSFALSPIIFILYLSLIFYVFKKRAKNLKISISFFFFMDNGLFIFQGKSLEKTKTKTFYSYNIISSLLK